MTANRPPTANADPTLVSLDPHTHAAPGASDSTRATRAATLASTKQSAGVSQDTPVVSARPAATSSERFVDQGEIGRGGMGTVHRIVDQIIRRDAAMKIIEKRFASTEVARRFLEEAQITGQLDHPNIAPVYDVGLDENGSPHFFTMKLVRGHTLSELLQQDADTSLGRTRLERVLNVMIKVCDAVAFAHSRGVVHRDLKPDNIMVGTYGQVYVMDWGIARIMPAASDVESEGARPVVVSGRNPEEIADEEGQVIGTIAYMSPEQALGDVHRIDQRTDVFGLGAVLYQVLTGGPPHQGDRSFQVLTKARQGVIPPPEEVAGDREVPPQLAQIAMRALAARQEDRYQTVAAFKSELEDVLRGGGWFPTKRFAAGEMVVQEGEAADAAYIIVEGSCEVFKVDEGEWVLLREMGPGEVFGETAVFTQKPRTASVRAVTELVTKVVTRESLERELGRNNWMAAFVKALAERFVDVDTRFTRKLSEEARSTPRGSAKSSGDAAASHRRPGGGGKPKRGRGTGR